MDQSTPDAVTEESVAPLSSFSGWFWQFVGLTILSLPILAACSQPRLMQGSDYLMNFFVAGKMVLEGHGAQLYPGPAETSFLSSAFNQYAHQLLPHLAPRMVSVYMYSPLIAALFSPFALLSSSNSLIAWQVTSIAAFLGSAKLMASATGQKFANTIKHGIFYMPVFHTILIGQLGLCFGLLPLSLAYLLAVRGKPLLSGCSYSLLVLKPQFFPVGLLVAGAQTLNRQFKPLCGLLAGLALIIVLTIMCLSPQVMQEWLSTLKLSDSIFSDPRYGYPVYLVSSLPAVLLHFFPVNSRNAIKLFAYTLALLIGLHALWLASRLSQARVCGTKNTSLVFALGICVLPLVLPHLLFYDLSGLAIFGMLAHSDEWTEQERHVLRQNHWIYLISLNIYILAFLFTDKKFVYPAILVAILIFLYWRLVELARIRLRALSPAVAEAVSLQASREPPN